MKWFVPCLNQSISEVSLQKFHLKSISCHNMAFCFLFLFPINCKGWCETTGYILGHVCVHDEIFQQSHLTYETIFLINTLPSCHLNSRSYHSRNDLSSKAVFPFFLNKRRAFFPITVHVLWT